LQSAWFTQPLPIRQAGAVASPQSMLVSSRFFLPSEWVGSIQAPAAQSPVPARTVLRSRPVLVSVDPVHRSRLFGIFIDTPAPRAAADFWSAALGVPARPVPGEEQFTSLEGAVPGLVVDVQAVDDTPRYHVDIETDDVPAEVARLTALGAEPVSQWLECHTLRAPGGHLLCVVPVHSDATTFDDSARTWP
jgi:hypothetical protein